MLHKNSRGRKVHAVPSDESQNKTSDGPVPAVGGPTSAGSEAATGSRDPGAVSERKRRDLDSKTKGGSARKSATRPVADPRRERTWVHESGYGGKNGQPRTSSDQRETAEQDLAVTKPPKTPPPDDAG